MTVVNGSWKTQSHHPGVLRPWQKALCGCSLYDEHVERIEGKITCPDCLLIIKQCRKIYKKDL